MDGNKLSWGPSMGQEMEVSGRLGASRLKPIFLGPNMGTSAFFPSSGLAMERGRKMRKKMGEKGELLSEAAAGRSLEHPKSLILWDMVELALPP
ncbi:hypothetical protein ACE6H2_016218 [Prunus campanulata]